MHEDSVIESLLAKVGLLASPWCDFSLDKSSRYDIRGQDDYDAHGVVRELIYHRFCEEASISMGRLPPIISPMFWETLSGYPVEKVRSLKNPNTHVSNERYEGYKRMARYWKPLHKVYSIDLRAYRGSLKESYDKHDFSPQRRVEDIDRRLNSLELFRKSLAKSDWPKLLVIVPESPEVWQMDKSFTLTPHMEVELIRGEGRVQHQGWLYYSPEPTDYLKTAWNQKWKTALDYARSRADWPNDLVNIDLIDLFQDQCQQFNLGSVDRLREVLSGLKKSFSGHADSQPVSKKYDAFLCHASVDKGAIVRRFHDLCEAKGIKTWFDEKEVSWGDRIIDKISHGLANSRFVVVFVSENAVKKEWVREELNAALTLGVQKERFVLPVLLGYTIQEFMEQYPVIAGRRCLNVPIYDPNIAVENLDLEELVGELERLIRSA